MLDSFVANEMVKITVDSYRQHLSEFSDRESSALDFAFACHVAAVPRNQIRIAPVGLPVKKALPLRAQLLEALRKFQRADLLLNNRL
jgi:hypothetical protein